MGSPNLKKKAELNYRRGYTHSHCGCCDHMTRILVRKNGAVISEPRCHIIGIDPGRAYKINPNNICDNFDNTELLRRLWGKQQ